MAANARMTARPALVSESPAFISIQLHTALQGHSRAIVQFWVLRCLWAMPSTVATTFSVETQVTSFASLALDCGVTLKNVDVAYETYGKLNADRSNAILVLHAFSGDAHAAGIHLQSGQPGWWSSMVGPGLPFD